MSGRCSKIVCEDERCRAAWSGFKTRSQTIKNPFKDIVSWRKQPNALIERGLCSIIWIDPEKQPHLN
jgi:hypothetical protein